MALFAFPLPCLRAVDVVTEAEALAESFLQEGSGSLWSAVREVVRCLPFEDDGREVADGRVFRLGLYCKGGFMGVSKTSWSHVASGRLLNAADLTTFRGHHWTSLSINKGQPYLAPPRPQQCAWTKSVVGLDTSPEWRNLD